MRFCQLFSTAVVALGLFQLTGCAAPSAQLATGVSAEQSPLSAAMEQAHTEGFSKRAE